MSILKNTTILEGTKDKAVGLIEQGTYDRVYVNKISTLIGL